MIKSKIESDKKSLEFYIAVSINSIDEQKFRVNLDFVPEQKFRFRTMRMLPKSSE